jgi:tripartite-type tricarboxylate transporter receptor subunit TctC
MVAPVPPAGAVDIVARVVTPGMAANLGQNVNIDNRGGANYIVGTEIVARSAPDGYTLLVTAGSHTINPSVYKKLPYDAIHDFAPIGQICNSSGLVLVVHPSFPAKSVAQLIELAKANPGKYVFGSGGIGNLTHLGGEMFKYMAGVQITHVPYKGVGPAMADLVAGQIPIMFGSAPPSIPHVKAGRLRALAFTGAKRSPQLPDVPTMDEAGLKGYEMSGWYGIYAPARTPRAIIVRLNEALVAALKTREIRERLAAITMVPIGSSPDEFAAFLKADIVKYATIVKAAGIEPQ